MGTMITLRNIFRRLVPPSIEGGDGGGSVRLAIAGIPAAPITPEPDDAELAAEAFLQTLSPLSRKGESRAKARKAAPNGSSEYYQQLAEKIKAAHEHERRAAKRFVAFAESELCHDARLPLSPKELASLEQGLFKHQETAEREKGELLRRWQHCLADVTVSLMEVIRNGEIVDPKNSV